MTIGSVTVNFQVVLPQGHTTEDVEMHLATELIKALSNYHTIVEFEVVPGQTQTKVDPFEAAEVRPFARLPLALR